ncbi:MAG: DNA mismatch repair endonuclease MutL, partial [Planctomycetes bacterium]|nr:DNA mismatch repair endonuclease MutL [Planctomycetota bacterium]
MPEIHLLPEQVRNRIAAGEVLERPASAVKELVENAIDANATAIEIEIAEGGRSLLRVADNGHGIPSKQLATAVLRYATSKIHDVADIFKITSMGFRGEALPSIAAVSYLEIASRTPNADAGEVLVIKGGEVLSQSPSGRAPGTAVTVRDLFYNTPARRKFLKSARSEAAAIHEAIIRLALGHPEIAYRFINGGKTVLDLPQHSDVLSRLGGLFGEETLRSLIPIHYQAGVGVTISGFIGRPPESRANSRGIYTFVNRRYISHPPLTHVLRQAFEGTLPARRYPLAYVFLAITPEEIDINVHPTKLDIRFSEPRMILGALHRAVETALRGGDDSELEEEIIKSGRSLVNTKPGSEPATINPSPPGSTAAESAGVYTEQPRKAPTFSRSAPASGKVPRAAEASGKAGLFHLNQLPEAGNFRVLGQAHDSYLVVESTDGVLLIDQHALHERLIYEELRQTRNPASQKLLVPAVVELTPEEFAICEEIKDELVEMGFQVEPFGEDTLSLQAVPTVV